ncbi:uncharacterized protein LOC104901068 [Beta vulgaris subsp. vulgaris]|uniref:uncharacterized protein LOC104901068 n=1 Tax=Beta vulgaris subsp. vulgaris TaxID=3555 RepID=UPI002546F78C|nr:uncharacterized protein LOC104901068 [Beta vulgaris subsp. vulgaris]
MQQAEVREVDDDDLTGDDNDDSDYVFSDLDDDDDDNIDDVDLVDEDDLVVSDEIHEKSKTEFLQVFRDFCIQEGFAVTVERADSARYTAYCLVQSCSWRIHATGLKDNVSWVIKSITGKHNTCGRLEENPMVSSEWLCRHLLQDLEANPEIPVDALQKLCMERYRLNVTIRLLYKVRSIAREQIYGSFAESYALLPRIDGAHLSGYYKGVMLTVVAIDGNNEIFVVAFGVVASESIDSWTYFFRNLRLLFEKEGCQKDDWTFISDRMRGVESALSEVFPRATRRICCQHLYSNCKNAGWSGSAFHKLFWIAADAYNEYVFEKAMSKIKKHDAAAEEYLRNVGEEWSRHSFDNKVCCGHNTTNFVESFNACTKDNRDLPVLTLLEAVRTWIMKRMGSRFDMAVDMDPNSLTEYAENILKTRSDDSRLCHVTVCGGGVWHTMQAWIEGHIQPKIEPCQYVSAYFKGAAYKATYAHHVHPMADHTQWPSFNVPQINPPTIKRSAGRPAKQRKRGPSEARKGKRHKNNKCSICKELGHNVKTCKSKSQAGSLSASQQGRGRKERLLRKLFPTS